MPEFDKQEILSKPLARALPIITREVNEDDRTAELSFSSDEPIYHWFGYLILDHSEGSVRKERLEQTGAVLWGHDWMQQVGGISNLQYSEGKGRGTVKFLDDDFSMSRLRGIRDGILKSTSFGFWIYDLEPEPGPDGKQRMIDGEPVYRSRDWEPFEVSLVPIPADISVGCGRSLEVNDQLLNLLKNAAEGVRGKTTTTEKEMPDIIDTTVQQPATASANAAELARIADFNAIGEAYGEVELARDYSLTEGKTVADLKRAIYDKRQKAQTEAPESKPVVQLTDKERKQYSISRAILADANIRDGKQENCFELEVSETARQGAVRNIPNYEYRGGVIIPTNVALRGAYQAMMSQMRGFDRQFARGMNQLALLNQLTRAGLDTLTDTAGQELIFTEEGSFIDLLRNRAMIMQLGATVLPGLVGNVAFPKQIGAGTFSWMAENSGSDVGESNLTLDQVVLSPKTGQSTTSYSRQLLNQSNVNVDGLVQSDLVQITSLAIDRAAIHGSGASNQPTGIYATSGVNAVAFGGPITLAKTVDMETEIATDNADIGTMAYLTTPGARGTAKKTQEFSSTNGMALWRDGEVNGYRAEASNQVSSVMNASAATGGSSHGIIFGVWSQLLFGEWGAMEIITDPYRLKKQGMIEVTNFIMIDIKARYPESFCKGTGQSLS